MMITAYQPLARKYRPFRLSDLIGQEALRQTLTQAIAQNRIPPALLFHGMRGIGKTTAARIVAKALNCEMGIASDPCGTCTACHAIQQDRFLDVIEMDAASHTSVDDIREIIEASRYKAVVGRYKVYIIDEVHMLSKSAFNALLKTLEEPPPHVVFIFATTELQRVPETILSRCMHFDLKPIAQDTLARHLLSIAQREEISLEEAASDMIAKAAGGSARDALSLLDQAAALQAKTVTLIGVQGLLGLAQRSALLQLLTYLSKSAVPELITHTRQFFSDGVTPAALLEGVLDTVYSLVCLKTLPQTSLSWAADDHAQAVTLTQSFSGPTLMQFWQVLERGMQDVLRSTLPGPCVEMVLLRLAYLSELPHAHDLMKALHQPPPQNATTPTTKATSLPTATPKMPESFEALLLLVKEAREPILYSHLVHDVYLVSYQPQNMAIRLSDKAPKQLTVQLRTFLEKATQTPWQIRLVEDAPAAPTVHEQQLTVAQQKEETALAHPTVQSLLTAFPGATAHIPKGETIS